MAASMEALKIMSSHLILLNRVTFRSLTKNSRSCHVSVQEPVPSLAKSSRPCLAVNSGTIGRSPKQLQNRLLSGQISSAMNVRTFGVTRLYSVLPQREIYTTPSWEHEESNRTSTNDRKCWKCERKTDALEELFFCQCGVVQSPANGLTFFTLLNIEENFDLDLKQLAIVYKELQKKLHPDMFSQKSETEQSLAEQQSSLLNKAYFTLLKPLPRALYLLELHGFVIEEDNNQINPEFLMEVLELNERIGEASIDEIKDIESEIQGTIRENIGQLSGAFVAGDYQRAQDTAVRLKYYTNVESKVKGFYRDRM